MSQCSVHPPLAPPPPPLAAHGSLELAPALTKISATLRAILAALRADHAAGEGGAALALAGRAEAAVKRADLIIAAVNVGKIQGEALALAHERKALEAAHANIAA